MTRNVSVVIAMLCLPLLVGSLIADRSAGAKPVPSVLAPA